MSPAFSYSGPTRSPAGIVFVFCCVWLSEVFCSMANLPIGKDFHRSSSRDGHYGVMNDGDNPGE
jgi:hypothetical protein